MMVPEQVYNHMHVKLVCSTLGNNRTFLFFISKRRFCFVKNSSTLRRKHFIDILISIILARVSLSINDT